MKHELLEDLFLLIAYIFKAISLMGSLMVRLVKISLPSFKGFLESVIITFDRIGIFLILIWFSIEAKIRISEVLASNCSARRFIRIDEFPHTHRRKTSRKANMHWAIQRLNYRGLKLQFHR